MLHREQRTLQDALESAGNSPEYPAVARWQTQDDRGQRCSFQHIKAIQTACPGNSTHTLSIFGDTTVSEAEDDTAARVTSAIDRQRNPWKGVKRTVCGCEQAPGQLHHLSGEVRGGRRPTRADHLLFRP